MGFLREDGSSWLMPFRRSASRDKQGDEEPDVFHAADCMERGIAHELTSDFLKPVQNANRLWKFNVERSEDRHQYRLYYGSDQFLLYARVAPGVKTIDIFLYDPQDCNCGLYDPEKPAFVLSRVPISSGEEEWILTQDRCDHCRGSPNMHMSCSCRARREIMVAKHSKLAVGDGINHSLEVDLHEAMTSKDRCLEPGSHRLVSKLPSWNKQVGSLVLNFLGRRVEASAKNFQLAVQDGDGLVACQYGKIGPQCFGLDFRYPLSIVQAFALALATVTWS